MVIKGENIMENELKTLKIVLKAGLTKQELKTLIYLLEIKDKTITMTNIEMSKKLGLAPSNLLRVINKLKETNILGERKNGLFVKSINSWTSPKVEK